MVTSESELNKVLSLFKAGQSKAEIGKVLGKDKKQVAKLLAMAIRQGAKHGND